MPASRALRTAQRTVPCPERPRTLGALSSIDIGLLMTCSLKQEPRHQTPTFRLYIYIYMYKKIAFVCGRLGVNKFSDDPANAQLGALIPRKLQQVDMQACRSLHARTRTHTCARAARSEQLGGSRRSPRSPPCVRKPGGIGRG